MHWKVSHTPHFTSAYRLLPHHVRTLAKGVFESLIEDPFHPSLLTHKLRKPMASYHALSVDAEYRIICRIYEGRKESVNILGSNRERYVNFIFPSYFHISVSAISAPLREG